MTIEPKALIMWENTAETPLDSSHLSKAIDFQTDSKFITYVNNSDTSLLDTITINGTIFNNITTTTYALWADAIYTIAWPSSPTSDAQVNKKIYNTTTQDVKIGQKNGPNYSWITSTSPYQKLLKIAAKSKFSLTYTNINTNSLVYANFDVGSDPIVLSIESLLINSVNTDFSPSTSYVIYLYWLKSYGNYAYFKIVKATEDTANTNNWKQGGVSQSDTGIDSTSPSGYKVIALRKVGGFKTTADSSPPKIDPNSVWDISTYHKEVTSEAFKIFDPTLSQTRSLNASDIPIVDVGNKFNAADIEMALNETKIVVDQLNNDMYKTQDRFGVELKFSKLKWNSIANSLSETLTSDISLKITAGYINIVDRRITVDSNPTLPITNPSYHDLYLQGAPLVINNNSTTTPRTDIILGQRDPSGTDTRLYEGVWRVYIGGTGQIFLKESNVVTPKYSSTYHGWYDMGNGARCIGKFKVTNNGGYYIEKMSIINTYDENIPTNVVIMVHGTMCPDGMVPCDGMWHDINGYNLNSYPNMPLFSNSAPNPNWQNGSWWEETPNMWGRTIKMIGTSTGVAPTLPYATNRFSYDSATGQVISGGSADVGISSGSDIHTHNYVHQHTGGTLSTSDPGTHTHQSTDVHIQPPESTEQVVGGTGKYVASSQHAHVGSTTTGGAHTHGPPYTFGGATADPIQSTTDSNSSWSPYKEILFCIKK
jgi:hypothetical protein